MKEPWIAVTRKYQYDVKVHTASYEGEEMKAPEFDGQLHAVLRRPPDGYTGHFNGGGAKFYEAKDNEWKEVQK